MLLLLKTPRFYKYIAYYKDSILVIYINVFEHDTTKFLSKHFVRNSLSNFFWAHYTGIPVVLFFSSCQ